MKKYYPKNTFPFFIFLIITCSCFSQAPDIEWQNTIGGSSDDESYTIQQTKDGGYIIGGRSTSGISGDKTEPFLGGVWGDYWILKLDNSGNIQWQNTLGGSANDYLTCIEQTFDGGYIAGGYSSSDISDDKSEDAIGDGYFIGTEHFNYVDYWVIKLDSSGNIEWQNTIGGDAGDYLYCIEQTIDSGYIVGGWSDSGISGDKTEASNYNDYWIVKLTASGDIEWQNTIGGASSDWLFTVRQINDGGYILGGTSASNISGDKTENGKGGSDYWVVKVDNIGIVQWDKTIGGHNDDRLYSGYCVQQTSDNGFILAGHSYSGISGDKTEANLGLRDYWLIKLDSTGNIEWQNTIGGNSDDILESAQQTTDGNYILGGISRSSVSGDKTEDHFGPGGDAGYDYWIVKVDNTGDILWQKTIGGTSYDGLLPVQQTIDGGYIIMGASLSDSSGNKTEESVGGYDYWIVKLYCENTILYYADADGDGYGSNNISLLSCSVPKGYVTDSTDCDDTNASIYPGAPEVLDSLDNDCDDKIDEGFVSVNPVANYPGIKIYPNPASDNLFIDLTEIDIEEIEFIVTDITGRNMLTKYILSEKEGIQLNTFSAGMYFICIKHKGEIIYEERLIKQ